MAWSSKLQLTLSTTEAEYVSGIAAGKEICWIQQLLKEVGYPAEAPSRLFIDNQSAISVANNSEHHRWMKHLDLAYYWLRDKVEERRIEMKHLWTEEMPTDLLTRALPFKATQVAKLREMIEMLDQGIVREVINYLFKEVFNQGVVFPRECAQTLYKFF